MKSSSQPTHKPISKASSTSTPAIGATLERCIYCAGSQITRRGRRYKQHEILQRWYCRSCDVSFSPRTAGKGSTYPLKVILETLCRFYQGHTIAGSTDYIRESREMLGKIKQIK